MILNDPDFNVRPFFDAELAKDMAIVTMEGE